MKINFRSLKNEIEKIKTQNKRRNEKKYFPEKDHNA